MKFGISCNKDKIRCEKKIARPLLRKRENKSDLFNKPVCVVEPNANLLTRLQNFKDNIF